MISRTYIINLERRTDKRCHMEKEMEKMRNCGVSLNPIFFKAIDGANPKMLSQYQFHIPNWFDPNSGKAMTNGEVGCALSHYTIWKEFVDDVKHGVLPETSKILIVEDDVIFPLDFMTKLTTYTKETNLQYDMLYVHRKPLNLSAEIKISAHINRSRRSYWTCGYILTYQGAKKLVDAQYLDNLIPVDEFLPIMYGCQAFGYEKLFANCEKLECFALCPSLLKLMDNAFNVSETFHSMPYMDNNKFCFGDNKEFMILYHGPIKGDSFDRFCDYCKLYGLPVSILGDTDISSTQKFFDELSSWSQHRLDNTLILAISIDPKSFCHVIPIASPLEIIEKYTKLVTRGKVANHNMLITNIYDPRNKKLMVCGWANSLFDFLNTSIKTSGPNNPLEILMVIDTMNNQNIMVDMDSAIFHSINLDPNITFNHKNSRIIVHKTDSMPCIVIGSEKTAILLNRIENYTGNNWNEYYGYWVPKQIGVEDKSKPKIYLSFFWGSSRHILNILDTLDYPKDRLEVHINRIGKANSEDSGIMYYPTEDELLLKDLEKFVSSNCDYYFFVNYNGVLENANVLNELLELNKDVVAPLLRRGNDNFTNFWGDLDKNGYYHRSPDYIDIIRYERQGCWNVPYVSVVYLIKKSVVEKVPRLFLDNADMDLDMRWCYNLRNNDIFIHVCNLNNYGYILKDAVPIAVEQSKKASLPPPNSTGEVTLYDLFTRREEWEKKYLHPEYYPYRYNQNKVKTVELCDGIYDFPLFSEAFCKELIQRAEEYGKWSKGGDEHNDPRLGRNYYENVPTVDIQLFEIGLDKHWHEIVFSYIAPMARVLYNNYKTKDINLAFVVKYDVKNQQSLAPHHDASTYTVNIALNRGNGVDYDGGGCRFIRQNYVLKNKEPGICSIHPGRLTAYHEGLPVTAGTRYILVSFIN